MCHKLKKRKKKSSCLSALKNFSMRTNTSSSNIFETKPGILILKPIHNLSRY